MWLESFFSPKFAISQFRYFKVFLLFSLGLPSVLTIWSTYPGTEHVVLRDQPSCFFSLIPPPSAHLRLVTKDGSYFPCYTMSSPTGKALPAFSRLPPSPRPLTKWEKDVKQLSAM